MATTNGLDPYATEREIIADARGRVRDHGITGADPMDRLIVVMGYVADQARHARCPGAGQATRLGWARTLERVGPWGVLSLFALWLLARETGFRLSTLLGG